jgi:hypothetical protein
MLIESNLITTNGAKMSAVMPSAIIVSSTTHLAVSGDPLPGGAIRCVGDDEQPGDGAGRSEYNKIEHGLLYPL